MNTGGPALLERLPSAWTRTRRRRRVLLVSAFSACALLFLAGVRLHAPLPAAAGLLAGAVFVLALRRSSPAAQPTDREQ